MARNHFFRLAMDELEETRFHEGGGGALTVRITRRGPARSIFSMKGTMSRVR